MKNEMLSKVFCVVRDIIEKFIPIIAFLAMFLAFILGVFFRYILNNPLTWTQDIIVVGFCWLVVLGASYTMRNRKHVKFTLLYENCSPKVAAVLRLIGNLIIVITFALIIYPSYKYCGFVAFQKTPTLRISYYWVFFPFVYFLISTILYTIPELIEDFKILSNKLMDSKDHQLTILEEVEN
jgi:TRAP-type C4-dicarboxylate transport system permease small subunit